MVAPPWIPVPPPGYGGIEAVVELLCDELVARGHDVTLFAAPGSRSAAHVRTVLDAAHPDTIGSALHESDHVASVWDAIEEAADRGAPFDVVHDHSGFTAVAMAGRIGVPVVHTLHGPLEGDSARFYERHGKNVHLVAISRSQIDEATLRLRVAAVVPNPIVLDRWPLSGKKDDYALWIGRMDPIKGAHRAIEAARRAGHAWSSPGRFSPASRTSSAARSSHTSTATACDTWARWPGSSSSGCMRTHARYSCRSAGVSPSAW